MVARTSQCDAERLKSFLDDDLSDHEQARFSDHLESCSDCQRMLERLAAGSELWANLRQLTPQLGNQPDPGYSVPGTAVFESGRRSERPAGHDHLLGFLAASDESRVVGAAGCLRSVGSSRPRRLRRGAQGI